MADDADLLRATEEAFRGSDDKVLMAFRVSKSQALFGVSTNRRTSLASKQRIFSFTTKRSERTQKLKVNLQVLKITSRGFQPAKVYKLKHLIKIEAVQSDHTGCTFVLGFDNLKNQTVATTQWTMRNVDDRNKFLACTLKLCKENLGRLPKISGMDVVEISLWAQENAKALPRGGRPDMEAVVPVDVAEDTTITMERDLVSTAEEEDMEALLDTYVMGIDEAEAFSERLKRELLALEAANVHAILQSETLVQEVLYELDLAASSVDDLDEWLRIFNVKLKHMREDIESIETRHSKLEMQKVNNAALVEELNALLDRLRIPKEYVSSLTVGSFEEARMPQNMEACEWLTKSLRALEPPHLDDCYMNMRAVREKRAELEKLKSTFVKRASEYLRNYFSGLVDFMINDKTYFSQRGQLKRPDHADLRFKCRTYARMLRHLKNLENNSLVPLRKAYCHSLNYLLRREAKEFANELKASTKVTRNTNSGGAWMEGSTGQGGAGSNMDTSTVSDAYAKMLRIFIPLLVDESTFFASFLCFDVTPLVPPGPNDRRGSDDRDEDEDEDDPGTPAKSSEKDSAELEALNHALEELLDGIQEDFYAVVEWAYKSDPLRCISMQGATERFLSSQKADAAGFVRRLLVDLQSRISASFNRFVDEACFQIEKHSNLKQTGQLTYITRFEALAQRMESLVQGNSREMVDVAYTKMVTTMFNVFEKVAQVDPKHTDIVLLENYAAFQNSLYELANVVPTLGRFYHTASDNYEQARTRYINSVINHQQQFEKLFQFGQKLEHLLYTVPPEEVPFSLGFSKADMRKVVKPNLAGVEKTLSAMYRRMQKQITSEELLPSLWEKCKVDFLDKYEALEAVLAKCYPNETLSPTSAEMAELFKMVAQ